MEPTPLNRWLLWHESCWEERKKERKEGRMKESGPELDGKVRGREGKGKDGCSVCWWI